MDDDELVRWFANIRLSDPVPPAADPGREMHQRIGRLVKLGVMPEPDPAETLAALILHAKEACRRHLKGAT